VSIEAELYDELQQVLAAESRMLAANEMVALHALAIQEAQLLDALRAIWHSR
jgi:hypothetical protein